LSVQRASKDRHRFLVGTCSLHDSNELDVLEYFEDTNHFEIVAQYSHPDQIWGMESSPQDPSLVVSSRQTLDGRKSLTLWKMDRQEQIDLEEIYAGPTGMLELEEKVSFGHHTVGVAVEQMVWHGTQQNLLLSVNDKLLTLWNIQTSTVEVSLLHFNDHRICFFHVVLITSSLISNPLPLSLDSMKNCQNSVHRFLLLDVFRGILIPYQVVVLVLEARCALLTPEPWKLQLTSLKHTWATSG
jgi:WD40 repeat protein